MRRGEYGLWSYQNQNFRLLSMTKTRPTEEISPVRAKGPKQPDWFKALFMGNRFGAWLKIINHLIIEDVWTTL